MPYARGLVFSNDTLSVDPGHQNSVVSLPANTLRMPMPSRSTGKAVAAFRVTSVPPFCTKSRMASTPSVARPVRYSGGVFPPRPPPRPPAAAPPRPPRPAPAVAVSARDGRGAVARNHQDVVLIDEVPGFDFRIENGFVRKIELLQHQAAPALIDVAASETLVHGHTLALHFVNAGSDGGT